MLRARVLFLPVLLAGLHGLHGMDLRITGGELGLRLAAEYNRTFLFCWDVATVGALELNSRHELRAGAALGRAGDVLEARLFAGGAAFPFAVPLGFAVGYSHNAIPEYEFRSDSLRFLAFFDHGRWGVALGRALRFNSFFGQGVAFEPDWSWSFHVFFVDNDFLRLGLRVANFDDFVSRSRGNHSFVFNNLVRIMQRIALLNEIEIRQSGSFLLASNFYGLVYRGGLSFLW